MNDPDSDPRAGNGGVLGSGLPLPVYVALILAATLVFLFWDGPLWSAPRGASHVQRIGISYALILVLAAAALLALRRFSWTRLVTATGTAWGFKLIITAVLYYGLARGTAVGLEAKAVDLAAGPAQRAAPEAYVAAPRDFSSAPIRGAVVAAGKPVPGAVVYLDQPAPGRPAAPARTVRLAIANNRYARELHIVGPNDTLLVSNRDAVLHLVHVHACMDQAASGNIPIPPSRTDQPLPVPAPGLYRITCDIHAGERAWLLVIDHPYTSLTDAAGGFVLADVVVGSAEVAAVAVIDGRLWIGRQHVVMSTAGASGVRCELMPEP